VKLSSDVLNFYEGTRGLNLPCIFEVPNSNPIPSSVEPSNIPLQICRNARHDGIELPH
jgi:hypothetical protein